ncbi:MAG: hypothetical protein AAF604_02150 [Acidobacteriota bacterium]
MASHPPVETGFFARRLRLACRPDSATLCLREGRFAVRIEIEDVVAPQGRPAVATALTSDTGGFWVFLGSLTDVEVIIRVEDNETGETWTYRKPPFVLESHADIEALPAPGP